MLIPLIPLLFFVMAALIYCLVEKNHKVVEIARAIIWASILVILWANMTVHVIGR